LENTFRLKESKTLCNNNDGRTFWSMGPTKIHFHSDEDWNENGFKIYYQKHGKLTRCESVNNKNQVFD